MPPFTSYRERRLWMWVLVTVVAIYATLGPAQILVAELRERNLLRILFILLLVIIGVVIIWRWVKNPPGWREIGVWVGVALVYTFAFLRVETPEERTHLIEYSLVAILIYQALQERVKNGRWVPYPAVLAFAATSVLGIIDEAIQAVLPNRVFDPIDIGFNTLAAMMAIIASLALTWVRNLQPARFLQSNNEENQGK